MPRKFFRKFALNRDALHSRWYLKPFSGLLGDPRLRTITRKSVVPAVAIGVFVAWVPLPGHMLIASLLAIALRANIAIAMLMTWFSNPITMAILFAIAYGVGAAILQIPPEPFAFELSWAWLGEQIERGWQPLFLGCFVLASATSAIAYVGLNAVWRASIVASIKARKLRAINKKKHLDSGS